jgi:hypothetical protein
MADMHSNRETEPGLDPALTGLWDPKLVFPSDLDPRKIIQEAFFTGQIVEEGKAFLLTAHIPEEKLSSLGFVARSEAEREEARSLVTKISTSASSAYLGRLVLAVIEEYLVPGAIKWNEPINDFESSWHFIKNEFAADDPKVREAFRILANIVLQPLRLPNSVKGEVRIASDTLAPRVNEFLEWSKELDKIS